MRFFETMGIPISPLDMRAISADEILNMQMRQNVAAQQAPLQASQYAAMRNWLWAGQPVDERPLDERFANFKVRLTAALEKYGLA